MSAENRPGRYTIEQVVKTAREVLLEHGHHVPTLIVEGEQGTAITQIVPFPETHQGRWERLFIAGMMLAQSGRVGGLEQVFFVSEGWISMADETGPPQNPPSQDPDRIEVLHITHLEVAANQTEMTLFEMVRDTQEQLVELKPLELPAGGHAESPLLAAFASGFRQGMTEPPKERQAAPEPLLPLGQVVATPGALRTMEAAGQDPLELLSRHVTGDWGDLDDEDKQENDLSVEKGFRILSAYKLANGEKIWLITEADRSATTFLRPDEY